MNQVPANTRASLLNRLKKDPHDECAWDLFVHRYQPQIKSWCGRWSLQESDADEVTQTVLVLLAVKMRSFRYDATGSFRAWLKTVTYHALCDFCSKENRRHQHVANHREDEWIDVLSSQEARLDLEQRLTEAFDLELLELATSQVRERVQEKTWQAFKMTTLHGQSGADVAQKLKISVASVFKAKSNVQKMLQTQIKILDNDQMS